MIIQDRVHANKVRDCIHQRHNARNLTIFPTHRTNNFDIGNDGDFDALSARHGHNNVFPYDTPNSAGIAPNDNGGGTNNNGLRHAHSVCDYYDYDGAPTRTGDCEACRLLLRRPPFADTSMRQCPCDCDRVTNAYNKNTKNTREASQNCQSYNCEVPNCRNAHARKKVRMGTAMGY